MMEYDLEPNEMACTILQLYPNEPYEIVLDFLDDALLSRHYGRVVLWSTILDLIENMQQICLDEFDLSPDMHSGARM